MGSGESSDTADSKNKPYFKFDLAKKTVRICNKVAFVQFYCFIFKLMIRHIILEIVLALLIKLKIMHIKHLTKIVGAPKKIDGCPRSMSLL